MNKPQDEELWSKEYLKEVFTKAYLWGLAKHVFFFIIFVLALFYSIQAYTIDFTLCNLETDGGVIETFPRGELYKHVPTTYKYWGLTKRYDATYVVKGKYKLTCEFIPPNKEDNYPPWGVEHKELWGKQW